MMPMGSGLSMDFAEPTLALLIYRVSVFTSLVATWPACSEERVRTARLRVLR